MEKSTQKVLGWTILGSIIGSVLGIIYGWLFAEVFKIVAIDQTPEGIIELIEGYGRELYSVVFVGLGWVAGYVVGGLAGLTLSRRE